MGIARNDHTTFVLGFMLGMFCGPCGLMLAIMWDHRLLPGGVVGLAVSFFFTLCGGGFGPVMTYMDSQGTATPPSGPIDPDSVRRINLDGTPVGGRGFAVPPLLVAAGAGVLISLAGMVGAAWMLVNSGTDEEEEEVPPPAPVPPTAPPPPFTPPAPDEFR